MPDITIYQVDVFTEELLTGNAAGVVPDASGLSEATMQAIAREMALSETAFVFPPEGPDHEVRVRFFTPTVEVPSCGHATVGTAYLLAHLGRVEGDGYVQSVPAGLMRLDVEPAGDGDFAVTMHQNPPAFREPLDGDASRAVLDALGVDEAVGELPLQWVDTGNSKVIVPVPDRIILDELVPDLAALEALSAGLGCGGYYVFTLAAPAPGVGAHARMFAPQIGIPEDPVTGNGAGPLGAYLALHGRVEPEDGVARLRVRQGEAMGRPGTVDVTVTMDGPRPAAVAVTGRARIVFKARMGLP